MWLFTQYGFYSVVCGRDLAGDSSRIDPETVMVRARSRAHLEALRKRFAPLAAAEIAETTNTDYRFRLLAPKAVWSDVVRELAAEIDYGNFKGRVERSTKDDGYTDALHEVWAVMEKLQRPDREQRDRMIGPARKQRRPPDES
jgi:hypothetical protein